MFARMGTTGRLVIICCVLVLVALVHGREAAAGTVLKLAHAHSATESTIGPSSPLFADNVKKMCSA
jgi:hypothetical protein